MILHVRTDKTLIDPWQNRTVRRRKQEYIKRTSGIATHSISHSYSQTQMEKPIIVTSAVSSYQLQYRS